MYDDEDFRNAEENEDVSGYSDEDADEACEDEDTALPKMDINALKHKYPKVYEVGIEIEELERTFIFYFKRPSMLSYNRVIKTMAKKTQESMKAFALECIVDEQRGEFAQELKEYPGLAISAGNKLLALMGFAGNDGIGIKKL